MPIYLQPIALPDRCYLEEVLYWVAFQRLPVTGFYDDGQEIRQSDDMGYAPGVVETELSDSESRSKKFGFSGKDLIWSSAAA